MIGMRTKQIARIAMVGFITGIVSPACSSEAARSGSSPAATSAIELQQLVTGLRSPVALTHAGDARLFITLQQGIVRIHDGQRLLPDPFLDIESRVASGGERGLLSIAFHPRYATNGFFYVNYTDLRGDTVIARYSVRAANPNAAEASSETVLLRIDQPFSNHNGGQLQFGPDGFLYIGMGDGGSGGDPQNNGQTLSSLLGKMLRIDVDGATPYAIPPGNPFVGRAGARPEIWAYGLRNPWRFSFDRSTGDMFVGDVGQNLVEEIDFQPASSRGGENYGWRRMEGSRCFNPSSNCNDGSLVLPIAEYVHNTACSVTGGYRYRGARYPRLQGIYFYGDYCSGQIFGTNQDTSGGWTTREVLRTSLSISSFGEDRDGELYILDLEGTVYRIIDSRPVRVRAVKR